MPSATALRPEPQSWFRPQAVFSCGTPALIAACRAGFWPCPAVSTWPRITSSTSPPVHLGALQRLLDGDRAQIVRRRVRERAIERADRRARRADDDDLGHGILPSTTARGGASRSYGAAPDTPSIRSATQFRHGGPAIGSLPAFSLLQKMFSQTRKLLTLGTESERGDRGPRGLYFGNESMVKTKDPTTIKKYANRRLYNTGTSTYVTLEDLGAMVKAGEDFVVFDAKTNEDITRQVLTQIIFEQENKGHNLLPITFLRQLIRFYGDCIQAIVPSFLEFSIDNLTRDQQKIRDQMTQQISAGWSKSLGRPVLRLPRGARQNNMAVFERAFRMFSPFNQIAGRWPTDTRPPSPRKTTSTISRRSSPR